MLKNSIIDPSDGGWSSPIVPITKLDGAPCMCVDYRKFNAENDSYPVWKIVLIGWAQPNSYQSLIV